MLNEGGSGQSEEELPNEQQEAELPETDGWMDVSLPLSCVDRKQKMMIY